MYPGCLMRLAAGVLFMAMTCGGLPVLAEEGGTAAPAAASYLIGPGDRLEIAVWKEEALTKRVPVLPDGTIAFPLVGEIHAAGKSAGELKAEMETLMGFYMPEPVISIVVQEVNSMLVYVIGQVKNPGRFALNANLNVMQVLAMAGGLTPFARRGEIKIFRDHGKEPRVYSFDYDAASEGKDLSRNIQLERGDVIVVR